MSTIVHTKIKGTTYCYRSVKVWDETTLAMKTKRILIGKIDPKTGEMVPTRPRGGKHPISQEDYDAIVGSDSDGTTKDDNDAAESAIAYKKQCKALKVKLVETQNELTETQNELEKTRRELSQLKACIRTLPVWE